MWRWKDVNHPMIWYISTFLTDRHDGLTSQLLWAGLTGSARQQGVLVKWSEVYNMEVCRLVHYIPPASHGRVWLVSSYVLRKVCVGGGAGGTRGLARLNTSTSCKLFLFAPFMSLKPILSCLNSLLWAFNVYCGVLLVLVSCSLL